MPTIQSKLNAHFTEAIRAAFDLEADPQIGVSQNEQFGDYQSNAAMSLAKKLGQKPREVAEKIKANLNLAGLADEITIAGPGFINVKLSHAWLAQELQKLLNDPRLGIEKVSQPQTVVVDYSGPNIAKEMHVGHLRSTIIGDAISLVLEFQGHHIIRQNHIGDWGTQFGMLIENLIDKFPLSDVRNRSLGVGDLNDFYQEAKRKFDGDPQFADRSRTRVVSLQGGDPQTLDAWDALRFISLKHFDRIYERLGVPLWQNPSAVRGESFYNDKLPGIITELKRHQLAVQSDGATVIFIDGPDKPPMIVEKTGGGYLYATTDLAALRFRVEELRAQRIVYVHDSRQAHHFAQLFAVAKKAHWAAHASLEYAAFGTMLGEDGKPFKTRSGATVKLKDLLDEAEQRAWQVVNQKNAELPESQKQSIAHAIGIGGVKYSDLAKDRIADYVFSFDKMLSLDGNTAPYLQYAHARIRSIFRKADSTGSRQAGEFKVEKIKLESPYELSLAKHILRLGEVIEAVARDLKPHLLCTYLYDLATKFSGFYENCPVIQSEEPTRTSRLAICQLTAATMALGLDLLGIEHPDQM